MLAGAYSDTLKRQMKMSSPLYVNETNLSRAWARAFVALTERGVSEFAPLVVSVSGFCHGVPQEDPGVRGALDSSLAAMGFQSCRTVANTIFPNSLWNPAAGADALFERYLKILPRLQKGNRANQYGLYFGRMIAFQPAGTAKEREVNQLKHILETWRGGNHRRSALQLSIFDPTRDHTDQRQRGFPCLQQVAFSPSGSDSRQLTVTAFYATQYFYERAYGNYLGLCDLGRFVAREIGLELNRMTCVAAIGQVGKIQRKSAEKLAKQASVFLRNFAGDGQVSDGGG